MIEFFKKFLIENKNANSPEFQRLIYFENINRFILTLLLVFGLEFVIMIFEFMNYDKDSPIMEFAKKKPMLLIVLLLFIMYFHSSSKKNTSKLFVPKRDYIILYGFLALIISWGLLTTLHVQKMNGELSVLILITIGIAAALYIKPLVLILLYTLTYSIFFVALPAYQSNPGLIISHYWNLFASLSLGLIIARSIYKFRLEIYLDRMIIEQQNKELMDLATKDGLTRLYNHRYLYDKLKEHLELATRYKHDLTIAILDLDDFKKINDSYGHLFGDQVLKSFAEILTNFTRTTDIVGRYGGEEFLIIFPSTTLHNAFLVTDRIRSELAKTLIDGINVTISGGLVSFTTQDLYSFINDADELLYHAKNSGKNKISY